MADKVSKAALGAEAAQSAVEDTAEAIERAAEANDDPAVADALDDAAISADVATTRVSWLAGVVRRLIRRP